ncbi:hypothetical protein AGMMS50268_09880 [Spirochaetia bacterium]|nr:hypothetical protein AGMMS50268_09880 [Spirochaetia bacterium]
MKRLIILVFFPFFVFLSCGTQDNVVQTADAADKQSNVFSVNIVNNTFFDIEIHSEDRLIFKKSEKVIKLPIQSNELTEGYTLTFLVPLSKDVTKKISSDNNIVIKSNQKVITIDYPEFSINESYFSVANNSERAIKVVRTNSRDVSRANLMPDAITGGSRIEFPKGVENVYIVDNTSSSVQAVDKFYIIPVDNSRAGFFYTFTFDGNTVTLTDARPLHRIGETGWTRIETRPKNTEITAEIRTADDNILVIGSNKENPDSRMAIIQKRTDTGSLIWEAIRSTKPDSSFAYMTCVAYDAKNEFFLAGGASDMQGIFYENYSAYLRSFDNTGKTLWELGHDDFIKVNNGDNCGPVRSVSYDTKADAWRFCGVLLDGSGSYTGIVSGKGDKNTLKINTAFEGFTLYAIQCTDNGLFFVAGSETKANRDVQTVAQKFGVDGKLLWKTTYQLKPPSHYQTAFFDADYGQLVLGGTLGGKPFIQGIDSETGKETWFKLLDYADTKNTVTVSAIERASEYGFILSLCGVNGEELAAPFVTARVGERGAL